MPEPAERISLEDMTQRFRGGPELKRSAVVAVLGGRIYKRESDAWYLLEDKPREPRTP